VAIASAKSQKAGENVQDKLSSDARDLEADLKLCEAATPGPWKVEPKSNIGLLTDYVGRVIGFMETSEDREFSVAAREGWPYAIRRALAAEAELDRLRQEIARLKS
jgi:hypothetical protein